MKTSILIPEPLNSLLEILTNLVNWWASIPVSQFRITGFSGRLISESNQHRQYRNQAQERPNRSSPDVEHAG